MTLTPLALMACMTTPMTNDSTRPVVVANDSAHVYDHVRILAGGQPVLADGRLLPGRVLVAQVPDGDATVAVDGQELSLPATGAVTAIMDTEGIEWAVGPSLWADLPTVDADLLPWGSQLSEDLSTGTLPADAVDSLVVRPWDDPSTPPTRYSQLADGRETTDAAEIEALLRALQAAHRSRATGPLSTGPSVVILAHLRSGADAWFVMTTAAERTRVYPPPMSHEAGRHDRTVGQLDPDALAPFLPGR